MAYVTPIGSNPEQVEYRLDGGHGCGGSSGSDRRFSYHTDGRERPLRWIGEGLREVGIEPGSVLDETQFDKARALMDGRHPHSGEVLHEAKRGVPDDAKVASAPLVRAIEAIAAEADVSVEDALGYKKTFVTLFERMRRAVEAQGEAARNRADDAGKLADAAGLAVDTVWDEGVYAAAAANLWETVPVRQEGGTVIEQRRPRRVIVGNAGYDVTFTLPKSMSMVLAFADGTTAARVEDIYMQGVQSTFAWLEDTAAYGQRGHHGNGQTAETVKGTGFLGWTMVHRAARPTGGHEVGDPHWHVHTTLANMTRGEDGHWSAVASGGRDLMRHAATVDHMLKALVRHELSARLGVRFNRNTRTGAWEVVGISDATLEAFSKRHGDIDTMLETLGYERDQVSRTQERIAEQRSRSKKTEATAAADATLQQIWQSEERAAGRDPAAQMRSVFGGGNAGSTAAHGPDDDFPSDATGGAMQPTVEDIAAELLNPEHGLTAHSRRFTRADALACVADTLPTGCGSAAELEALTTRVLAHAGFLALPEYGHLVEGPNGKRDYLAAGHMANADTYTTQDVVDAETIVLRTAKNSEEGQLATRVNNDTFELGAQIVEAQQPFPLDVEQRAAVQRVTTSGRAIETITGRPGTGKTTIMRAVRAIYEAAGFVVGGAATAAVAAQNLEAESAITADTVASYVHRIAAGDEDVLRGVDALVIDEANLTEDRDRAALYQRAEATGTQIIEVGDGKQLRGVGIGSLFARIHEIVAGAELTANRRQADEDEQTAIEAWRDGRYVEALSVWRGRGHFHAVEKTAELSASMVAEWWRHRQGAPDDHTEMRGLAMLAATNEQVRRLNDAAQSVRVAEGELGAGRTYDVAGGGRIRLHVGDHILVRVNDRAGAHTTGPPVLNGYRAVVRHIDRYGAITAEWQRETSDGIATETADLSPAYIGIGGVELGYAITIHKAEGLTVGKHGQWHRPDGDQHFGKVLFSAAGADNPAAYVALSRHLQSVDIFGALEQLESEQERYLLGPPRTRAETEDRAIAQLAEHARRTAEHGDDRPVVVDLGLPEFQAEGAAEQQAAAAVRAEQERLREHRETERQAREARRAERERRRAETEERTHERRDWASDLLRTTWRHEPGLAEAVIAAAAFDTVATNLHDAALAGYDVHEVLAQIPTSTLTSPRIHDKARFTAWGIDHAVQRMRTGAVAREEHHAAERARFEQMRDQAADLLERTWSTRPELAEAVTTSAAFPTFVTSLDYYTTAGLNPRELLAHINLGKLTDPSIRDTGAFAAYALRRVGDRALEDLDEAHHRAEQRAERETRHRAAADTLRQAWSQAPTAAETVIGGRAFGPFVEQLTRASEAGYDPGELLGTLNPQQLTAPGVHNPSAAATYALKRALDHADTHRADTAEIPVSDTTRQQLVHTARQWAHTTPETTPTHEDHTAAFDPGLDRLAAVHDAAAEFYTSQLDAHPAELDYLAERLPDVAAARASFTIGYAPNQWRGLTDHLRQQGFSDRALLDAGVAKRARTGALIDQQRGRIVLGVRDEHGRLAGWIGRDRTNEPTAAKYLNTPATELYDKSRTLFGLAEQRDRLAAGATPVVVEGTFDAMALATSTAGQHIVPITTSGTAVTRDHLDSIRRATGRGELVLGLDGDTAGQAAAARTAREALNLGLTPRVVTLPGGHDPASWVHAHTDQPARGAAPYIDPAWQRPAAEMIVEQAIEDYFATRPPQHREEVEGHLGAARAAAQAVSDVDLDTAVRTGRHIAEQTGIEASTVMSLIGQHRTTSAAPHTEQQFQTHTSGALQPAEPELEQPATTAEAPEPAPAPSSVEAGQRESSEHEPDVPHWREREHGHLSDTDLADRLEHAQQRADHFQTQAHQAEVDAHTQRQAADAGEGAEVRAVDEHLHQLREHATRAREADEVDTRWHNTVERAAAAAEERARAEYDRDSLGRFARSHRAELTHRITEVARQETTAADEAAELAQRARELSDQVGDRDERRHLPTRANAAETDYPHAHEAAQRRDYERAEAATRRAARLADHHTEAAQHARALHEEQQLRAHLPEQALAREHHQRVAQLQHTTATAEVGHEMHPEQTQAALEPHPADLDQELTARNIDEPEL